MSGFGKWIKQDTSAGRMRYEQSHPWHFTFEPSDAYSNAPIWQRCDCGREFMGADSLTQHITEGSCPTPSQDS